MVKEALMSNDSDMKPSDAAQPGVEKTEAVTISYNRWPIFTVLILYFLSLLLTYETLVRSS